MTDDTIFEIDVLYSQIAVFDAELEQPFNAWSDTHVRQGFAWRPGSVSFRTLVEAGRHAVEVRFRDEPPEPAAGAVRAVAVPFEMAADRRVEIGSISSSREVVLPFAVQGVTCEFLGPGSSGVQHVLVTFLRRWKGEFRLLRADKDLSPPGTLLTTATPA